jgi:predicted amidohydrolase YtcJ
MAGVKYKVLASWFIASVLAFFAVEQARAEGALVLRGGAVYTLDPARPWARAVVVRDGRIVFVGDDAGALALAGPDARVIALNGRMVMPGLHDSHIHPMSGGMRLVRCRLGGFKTAEAVYAAVRACAAAHPERPWLLGAGWSPAMFGREGPSLAKLDELVPDRPAFLTTEDGYTGWVNSPALASADLAATSGVVDGEAADRVRAQIPRPSGAEYREALKLSTAMANRFGITSMVDASAAPALVEAYYAADQAGELTVRVVAAQRIDPALGTGQVDDMVARRDATRGRRFRADGAKIFLDGEVDRRTAAMIEPYAGKAGGRGDLFLQPAALNAIVRRLDAEGFLVHMHAMGDRAVRVGLDAIELAGQTNGARDRRHQLTHICIADRQDIRRFGTLGVAANFQPLFLDPSDPAAKGTTDAVGRRRARSLYPIASIAAGGALLLASSDWPAPSMNPFDAIQVAMTRQTVDGSKPAQQPSERVDLATMLAAYTVNGAWAAREEAINGAIVVGKAADLIVLDRNLFETRVGDIHKTRVLLTLLDGESVYSDPQFMPR